ncbi:MAG: manganese efflux pump [Rhodospirillaceae bacterium]|nr:manganese efflux pump [Rhodospirillaceae bacterium]
MLSAISLAVGLSVDSLAAAMAAGVVLRRPQVSDAARVGAIFGCCQMGLTLLGVWVGAALSRVVNDWDHWIAFALLLMVSGQMAIQAVRGVPPHTVRLTWMALLAMGVGTSIDAGVVGIGFGLAKIEAGMTVAIIGIVTFVFSFFGVLCGCRIGRRVGGVAQLLGSVVLAVIGTRILMTHLAG